LIALLSIENPKKSFIFSGKKQKSQKLKSPRSSSPEFNSCHCEALSENKVCIIYSFKISDWKCLVPVVVV
jgi:hypothetical protein